MSFLADRVNIAEELGWSHVDLHPHTIEEAAEGIALKEAAEGGIVVDVVVSLDLWRDLTARLIALEQEVFG